MSIPKGILEWAVYCHLHDYKDTQMILLKGHLLIEEVLTSIVGNDDLSFYAKIGRFKASSNSQFLVNSLVRLNRLRNKLAHEWRFESESAEVQEWADSVLKNIPYMMDFRRTKRTRVIHAIAALAGAVLEQGQKGK